MRVKNNLVAFKFNTKFIKNSLEYRGSVFWNLVHDSEDGSHLSLFKRKRNEDYFKDFNIKMQWIDIGKAILYITNNLYGIGIL